VFADDGTHGQELMSISSHVAPVIASVASQSVTQGQTISLDLGGLASDASVPGQVLTYSLTAGAPAGATINPITGLFTWTPSLNTPVSTYTITAIASDGDSSPMSGAQAFNVNVLYGGPPPVIVSTKMSTKKGLTITLNFSQPLAPGPAQSAGDYQLIVPPKTRRGRPRLISLTPHYTAGTTTVTLTTRTKLSFSPALQLTVLGSAPGDLANVYGSLLDGDANGQPGSNFLALVTRRGLAPVTSFPLASGRTAARVVRAKSRARAIALPVAPKTLKKGPGNSARHGQS
jgi:hypothetical protein